MGGKPSHHPIISTHFHKSQGQVNEINLAPEQIYQLVEHELSGQFTRSDKSVIAGSGRAALSFRQKFLFTVFSALLHCLHGDRDAVMLILRLVLRLTGYQLERHVAD